MLLSLGLTLMIQPGLQRPMSIILGEKFQSTCRQGQDGLLRSADSEAELSTCLELIRRNMPWIRKTFVVTGFQQRPKCLKDEILIDHKDLGLGPGI